MRLCPNDNKLQNVNLPDFILIFFLYEMGFNFPKLCRIKHFENFYLPVSQKNLCLGILANMSVRKFT